MPRRSAKPLRYNDTYTIPPGTPFSMSNYIQHTNAHLFPDPESFDPARWLDSNSNKETSSKPLTNYLVPFSKGTRNCLGQHLAWAELYIGLATVFRKVEFELWETGPEAVGVASEYFVPLPEEGTKGVRVVVT